MREVMLSIQPKWCELIASGKKTIEVRKTRPKIETPFKVYIYCTEKDYDKIFHVDKLMHKVFLNGSGKQKVIGEFVCDEIKRIHCQSIEKEAIYAIAVGNGNKEYYDNSCMSYKEAYRYLRNVKKAYAWHISDLVIYDKPKELSKFGTICEGLKPYQCDNCEYSYTESNESIGVYHECCCDNVKPLKRAPQSWCYVEQIKERF